MKNNCTDCFHFKAKIKLVPKIKMIGKRYFEDRKFDWQSASARCSLGFLSGENGGERIIKNIFKGGPRKSLNTMCGYFEGMDD